MKMNMGSFVADGLAVNVDVGFIPDFVIAFEGLEEGTWQAHYWARERINAASAVGQFGLLEAAGTHSVHAAAVNGFAPLDSVTTFQMLPAPNGEGEAVATLPVPFVAGVTAPTARSTSVVGTVVKSSNSQEKGYVYECTASAGVYGTEPTAWPTVPGETVSDGTNTWICRESKIKNVGVKGFTLGATGQTDTDEWNWIAFAADKVSPDVDAANVVAGGSV
jgi:hypothetical protein